MFRPSPDRTFKVKTFYVSTIQNNTIQYIKNKNNIENNNRHEN